MWFGQRLWWALWQRADADDLLAGINWNFVLFVPAVELLFLIAERPLALALFRDSEASVTGAIAVVLLWRAFHQGGLWHRLPLAAGAVLGTASLLAQSDPGPAHLAAVLSLLFAAQFCLTKLGPAARAGALGAVLLADDLS